MLISKSNKIRPEMIKTAAFYIVVLLIAVGLKYHYSRADSDDLGWILGPTAAMVETISGVRFEKEAASGYIDRKSRIIIAPSCAGVNFLIIAFCMSAFSGLPMMKYSLSKCFWLLKSGLLAYLLTIVVNAFRIYVSIYTYTIDIYSKGLTPEQIHRVEGIFIYFFFLTLFYLMLRKKLYHCSHNEIRKADRLYNNKSYSLKMANSPLIPMLWYTMICLGIPYLNHAYEKNSTQFIQHSWMVISVCMSVFLFFFLIQLFCRQITNRIKS